MKKYRVLIVDDSLTIRQIIQSKLEAHPELEVVGEAEHPLEARTEIKRLNPDVLTLDIEMPHMSGLDFLEKLMRLRPMPVVMVSSLTQASTVSTIRALQLGAVDCVGKPTQGIGPDSFSELAGIVASAARSRMNPAPEVVPSAAAAAPTDSSYDPGARVLMIGSSTGGVEALFQVIKAFPANCPPTLITQHIPAHFSRSFAQRLDTNCAPNVVEASDGLRVTKGMVVIAPGSETHLEIAMRPGPVCRLREGDKVSGHKPSVDVLFRSGLRYADRIAAALLTGMGQDGAKGLLELREAGAMTYAQDEATCVVYGMPRAAVELGAVDKPIPLGKVAKSLLHSPIGSGPRRRAR